MTSTTIQDKFLSNLFDALPQSVTWSVPVWDDAQKIVDFQIRYANESGGVHIGVPRKQLIGYSIFSDIELDHGVKKLLWDQYHEVYNTGRKIEYTYYDPIRDKYLHVVRTKADDGVLTLGTDVSERERARKKLEQQTELPHTSVLIDIWRGDKGELSGSRMVDCAFRS
ncbi:MAG: hypothetical protein EOP50_02100, partial [Sphingobacteriales bacterium]